MESRLYRASATEGLFTSEQLRALVGASQRGAGTGVELAWIFQAVGTLLFFVLFWRSRLIPRAIAGLGVVGSVLLVGAAAAMVAFPVRIPELKLLGLPVFLAEVTMALWLLVRGIHSRKTVEVTP
jgi:hypothetical protein